MPIILPVLQLALLEVLRGPHAGVQDYQNTQAVQADNCTKIMLEQPDP
jgi:hypothetical protein